MPDARHLIQQSDGVSMNSTNQGQNESEPNRDASGRLLPGHSVGAATRFKPGVSGNPKGRPPAGLAVREHCNLMADWTEEELQSAANAPEASWAQRAAAERMLSCLGDRAHQDTKQAAADFDRICDRTSGKPTQQVEVTPGPSRTQEIIELSEQALQQIRAIGRGASLEEVERMREQNHHATSVQPTSPKMSPQANPNQLNASSFSVQPPTPIEPTLTHPEVTQPQPLVRRPAIPRGIEGVRVPGPESQI